MRMHIDTDAQTMTVEEGEQRHIVPLYSREAFELMSRKWVKVGWDQKYVYQFSWLGRPIIQFPEDMIRIQEVIYRLRPDVIVETGCRPRRIADLLRQLVSTPAKRPHYWCRCQHSAAQSPGDRNA